MSLNASPAWIAPIFLVHLGCPHRCVFCNQGLITESASPPSPAEVGEQLNTYFLSPKRDLAKQRQIAFYGGSFTGMKESLQEAYLEAAQPYLKQGLIDSIRISTRPDDLSDKQLAFLAERGVRTIELGIQSFSDTVLQASRRGYTAQQAFEGICRIQRMGLEAGAQIMIGLPGDTGRESLETVERLSELKPDFVRIYPLLVFPGTDLAEMMQRNQYRPLALTEAVSLCVKMLERLEKAAVPVIRIGLQEQAGMRKKEGAVLAGPYHPAFGHLVRSGLYLQKVLAALPESAEILSRICIRIHPADRPLLAGDRKENIKQLHRMFGAERLCIEEDLSLSRGEVECLAL